MKGLDFGQGKRMLWGEFHWTVRIWEEFCFCFQELFLWFICSFRVLILDDIKFHWSPTSTLFSLVCYCHCNDSQITQLVVVLTVIQLLWTSWGTWLCDVVFVVTWCLVEKHVISQSFSTSQKKIDYIVTMQKGINISELGNQEIWIETPTVELGVT